jgi:hypothetical protein
MNTRSRPRHTGTGNPWCRGGTFHRVGAAETHIGLASVDQVLHFDLHEGAALAGLGMLGLGDFPDALFIPRMLPGRISTPLIFMGMNL